MLHQLCHDVDGSLSGADPVEGHQVGMLELSARCKQVHEGVCVRAYVHVCACVRACVLCKM